MCNGLWVEYGPFHFYTACKVWKAPEGFVKLPILMPGFPMGTTTPKETGIMSQLYEIHLLSLGIPNSSLKIGHHQNQMNFAINSIGKHPCIHVPPSAVCPSC